MNSRILPVGLLGALLSVIPGSLRAQGNVFLAEEMDRRPVVTHTPASYYPKDAIGKARRVDLRMVITESGEVDSGSVRVLKAPDSLFALAARVTVLGTSFTPGLVRGRAEAALLDYTVMITPRAGCLSPRIVQGVTLCHTAGKH
jgi:hypothetical protein